MARLDFDPREYHWGTLHVELVLLALDGAQAGGMFHMPCREAYYALATGDFTRVYVFHGYRQEQRHMGARFAQSITFDIQRGSGKIFINDVGKTSWEEIDEARAGANYGWPITEGSFDPSQFPIPILGCQRLRDYRRRLSERCLAARYRRQLSVGWTRYRQTGRLRKRAVKSRGRGLGRVRNDQNAKRRLVAGREWKFQLGRAHRGPWNGIRDRNSRFRFRRLGGCRMDVYWLIRQRLLGSGWQRQLPLRFAIGSGRVLWRGGSGAGSGRWYGAPPVRSGGRLEKHEARPSGVPSTVQWVYAKAMAPLQQHGHSEGAMTVAFGWAERGQKPIPVAARVHRRYVWGP